MIVDNIKNKARVRRGVIKKHINDRMSPVDDLIIDLSWKGV